MNSRMISVVQFSRAFGSPSHRWRVVQGTFSSVRQVAVQPVTCLASCLVSLFLCQSVN